MIRRAVPEAQDVIGYGMPGYKLKGKPLLYFAVSNDTIHCLQHRVRSSPRSKKNSRTMSSERGTIHFPLNKPVPVQLISRIAKLRGESWKNADLRSPAYRMAHTRFGFHWNWDGKECVLMSRCTDELGTVQPTRADVAKYWNKPLDGKLQIRGADNSVQPWRVATDGSVYNGLS